MSDEIDSSHEWLRLTKLFTFYDSYCQPRHVARLCRLGERQHFRGTIVTGKTYSTELIIAIKGITGGATVLRIGHKTMLRAERTENIWFIAYPHLWRSRATLVVNKLNTNLSNKFVGARNQFGQFFPCPFLATCLCQWHSVPQFSLDIIKWWAVSVCPSVCLSVCRMPRPNSSTEKPRKPEIGKMETHHMGNPWIYLEVKRSKVKVTRPINDVTG